MVPPFLPPGGIPPHVRALIGYPMQSGVMAVHSGAATSSTQHTPSLKEEKSEEERVSLVRGESCVMKGHFCYIIV